MGGNFRQCKNNHMGVISPLVVHYSLNIRTAYSSDPCTLLCNSTMYSSYLIITVTLTSISAEEALSS